MPNWKFLELKSLQNNNSVFHRFKITALPARRINSEEIQKLSNLKDTPKTILSLRGFQGWPIKWRSHQAICVSNEAIRLRSSNCLFESERQWGSLWGNYEAIKEAIIRWLLFCLSLAKNLKNTNFILTFLYTLYLSVLYFWISLSLLEGVIVQLIEFQ